MTADARSAAAKSLAKPIVVPDKGDNFAPALSGARLCEITQAI
jgi:hypothetical protein